MVQSVAPTLTSRPEFKWSEPEQPVSERTDSSDVGTRQRWFAWSTVAAVVAVGLLVMPFADTVLTVFQGFAGMFDTAMIASNLMLTLLLFIKGRIQDRGDAIRLGTAYLFATLSIILQTASFPGDLMPAPLSGLALAPLWMWCFWRVGFGIAILRYAWFAGQAAPAESSVRLSVLATVLSTACIACVACIWTEILPVVAADGHFVTTKAALLFWCPPVLITVAALAAVLRLGTASSEQLWLVVGLVAGCMELWLDLRGSAAFTAGWYLAKFDCLLVPLAMLVGLLRDIASVYGKVERNKEAERTLARRDGLTRVFNRRHFDEMLEEEFRRARRQELPLSLVMLDIDFFRAYNECHGHQVGDECLCRVSAAIKDTLWRPGDTVARYGGEELAILLPTTDLDGAMVIAERMREAVAALGIEHAGGVHGAVTVSAGVGSLLPCRGDERPEDLVSAADRGLYEAKRSGRNKVRAGTSDEFERLLSLGGWDGANI